MKGATIMNARLIYWTHPVPVCTACGFTLPGVSSKLIARVLGVLVIDTTEGRIDRHRETWADK